jgi:hypothetical protein
MKVMANQLGLAPFHFDVGFDEIRSSQAISFESISFFFVGVEPIPRPIFLQFLPIRFSILYFNAALDLAKPQSVRAIFVADNLETVGRDRRRANELPKD